ncbi:phage capsid protein [uncultured Gemmiger sp.]|uniref:phage capsid protein n=1 Tax=uncultured Gemmiger sp. TaxID=1623490 RepID=UPI0025EA5858|nr:phage capsid protein [uncultured Gemmiger sp.]
MPNNTINYASRWQPELLEVMTQNALCGPFVTTNVRWLDAKTFHFTQMSVSGYKNHSRDGGWNRGKITQTDKSFTVSHDRDVEFLIDKADVDESNAAASVKNISKVFEQTQAAPEADALFFSKTAAVAKGEDDYHTETAAANYTADTVFAKLKGILATGKLRRYRARGALIMYVSSAVMNALEQAPELTHTIELTRVADGGVGVETRITELDGVPVMEVVDDEVFYDAFNFAGAAGGFAPAAGAHKINVLVASPLTTKLVPKISSIYFFAPGAHPQGDGYLYQNRALSDVFTFPNGKDGKIDSVFVDTDTAAVD